MLAGLGEAETETDKELVQLPLAHVCPYAQAVFNWAVVALVHELDVVPGLLQVSALAMVRLRDSLFVRLCNGCRDGYSGIDLQR